jgi:CheY-like chemotaxis protein
MVSPTEQGTGASSLAPLALIVDDDEEIRGLWRFIVSGNLGLRTVEARDGAEAVRLARERQPDVIIMDLAMPVMDGFEATRQLKADTATARIPIIAATGSVFDSQRVLEVGCSGYLLKPVTQQALAAQIARVLHRPELVPAVQRT